MTTTFTNPASSPPSTPFPEVVAGLLTGSGSMSLTLTAAPAPASVVVYVWAEDVQPGDAPGPGADPPGVGVSASPPQSSGWFEVASGTLTVGGGALAFTVPATTPPPVERGAPSYPFASVTLPHSRKAIDGPPVIYTAFVALLGAVAGDYDFSVT